MKRKKAEVMLGEKQGVQGGKQYGKKDMILHEPPDDYFCKGEGGWPRVKTPQRGNPKLGIRNHE